ncbi:C45 family peptidase [Candidatus Pacearchaeota archaeon]|nr:C45 family peptidase [Candidatus Pacearchaeota archaeon]
MGSIPYIKIIAKDNAELGFKIGKKLSIPIKKRINTSLKLYKSRGAKIEKLKEKALSFIPAIAKEYPQFLTELTAIAKGAGVPFEDLMVFNCEEEFLEFYIPRCTSIALKTEDNKILVGHNEDWLQSYKKNGLYLIHAEIAGRKFLALSYLGSLPGTSCGLNDKHIAFTTNSLNFDRLKKGIPRTFIMRSLLDAKSIKEAEKSITDPWRSICDNTLVADNKHFEDIETLWGRYKKFHNNHWLVHTNHPLLKDAQNKKNTKRESLQRYSRAIEIIEQNKNKPGIVVMKQILKDHKTGICGHRTHPNWNVTIASAIVNINDGWIEISPKPCKFSYKKYYL